MSTTPRADQQTQEVEFEERRGIRRVHMREGLLRVQVSRLASPIMPARFVALSALEEAGVSIDFMKLTPDGFAFIARADDANKVEQALKAAQIEHRVQTNRSIVEVYAVNMRDEQGLIASVVADAVESGAHVDHLGDMHDRILLVTDHEAAVALEAKLAQRIQEAAR